MGRPPCCDKLNVKRGLWTAEEDAKILAYVSKHGTGNWTALPKKAGLRRCGKSCRLRWTNYLRPDLKHDSFTPQEEELIVRLHAAIGSRWSIIAQQLPGRTDNDVKNYWNTKLRKKLSEMGIDPVTHKPFSQILADYGNIGCLPKYGTRIGSLTKDLRNAFISKTEEFPSPIQPAEGISNIYHNNNTNYLVPPKLEPIQECFLKNKIINSNSSISDANNSMDLLDQLQAIKLVAEASAHFFNEGSFASSSSSSTSTCSISGQEKSPLSFSWQDFLLEDAFNIPSDDHHHLPQEQENVMQSQSQEVIIQQEPQIEGMDLGIPTTSYSPHTSFVEALLDQENENFLDFPNLLEEPFSY